MITKWHIAQINVGTTLYDADDPRMSGFMNRLDKINGLADQSPGFVWRLQSESDNATDIDVGRGANFIINMSVWESAEALFDFVYRTGHRGVMVKRRQWFERPNGPYQVLWWVPAGHRPTIEQANERLDHLKRHGPTAHAFTFKQRFPAPEEQPATAL